jgi:opacity protein-like surface antigen
MGKLGLGLVILYASSLLSHGGTATYSANDKDVMEGAPPPCPWYRPGEWQVDLWGAAASPFNERSNDRYLNRATAWGGGVDLKYFFTKSIGFGLEGLFLDARQNVAGGGLASFTYRYPIGCSRFSPYAWGGLGATAGGSHIVRFSRESDLASQSSEEIHGNETVDNTSTNLTAQLGLGLQFRFTPHMGFMADYAWNFRESRDNDFGMVRLGVTLAY